MLLDQALLLKQQLADSFIGKRTPTSFAFSFAATRTAAGGAGGSAKTVGTSSMMAARVRNKVNGVGVTEDNHGESKVKILTRERPEDTKIIVNHFGIRAKDVIIEQTGPIRFKSAIDKHRPPFPGISVGHYNITAGTLGCFVQDKKGKIYILSNNHVFADTNKGYFGDPILQPGPLDGGKRPHDVIATLHSLVPLSSTKPNEMDAAIALMKDGLDPDFRINQEQHVSGLQAVSNNLKVEKYGRTTNKTVGSITTRNLDLEVDYDGQMFQFQDQFEIKGVREKGQRIMFCKGGDSGSLILEKDSFKAVGLLFAGNDEGTTFATPINVVLDAFSVKIL